MKHLLRGASWCGRPFGALFLLLTGVMLFATGSPVAAQSESTEWTAPINLSQSGAASDVIVVQDSDGVVHVLWIDAVSGFVYTRSEAGGWSAPAALEPPFMAELTEQDESSGELPSLFVPQLRASSDGRIHAFWLDDEANLQHSAVPGASFGQSSGWTGTTTIAEGVLASAITLDAAGSLHLAYIQSQDDEESPAGVYYRRSDDGAVNWTPAIALSHSAYFRSLTAEQANISIATTTIAEAGRVVVAWDLSPREKVFMMQSYDRGATWPEAQEVDARNAGDVELAQGPSRIQVAATGSEIHLFWQAGHDGALCSQYHQWSPDGGASWEAPQIILQELLVCPGAIDLLVDQGGRLLLAAAVEGEVQSGGYLAAWNGARWSELQQQEPLTSFTNPETLRPVSFSCFEYLLTGERLTVVGCSSGAIQDIWLLARPVGNAEQWFPPPSGWEVAPVLATAATEIRFTAVVPDRDGWLHVLWVETDSPEINYVRWDGSRWSRSLPVLTSPAGVVDRPLALLTADRRLLVTWNDVESGQIYYSQTGADVAAFAEEWIAPRALPLQRDGVTSADIVVEGENTIYVVFAVPINEGRGIYLIRSDDLGESWSEPAVIFDAVASDWAMVEQPQMTVTADGNLHLLWTRYTPPPNTRPSALVYARSVDGGESWSPPETVTDSPLLWSRITGAGQGLVHRHWQEPGDGRGALRQQTSVDNGQTWSFASQAADMDAAAPLDLLTDAGGQLHLVYGEGAQLGYRTWDGERWAQAESLALERIDLRAVTALAAAVTSDSSLALVIAGRVEEREAQPTEIDNSSEGSSAEIVEVHDFTLQFARQAITLAPVPALEASSAPAAEVVVPEAEEVAAVAPLPSPAATTETAAPVASNAAGQSSAASPLASLNLQTIVILALLPAGLLILLVLALGLYRTRKAD